MKKSLVQLALNPLIHGTSKNPKTRFQISDPSLGIFPSSSQKEEVEVADGAKFDAYLQILFLDFPRERPIWNIKIKFPFSFYPHSFSFFEKQN